MSTTVPPKKRPGAPTTLPPADDFDEDAPTSVVPGPVPPAMPKEFDEGGSLADEGVLEPVGHADDDDAEDATKDSDDDADGHAGPGGGDGGLGDDDTTPAR